VAGVAHESVPRQRGSTVPSVATLGGRTPHRTAGVVAKLTTANLAFTAISLITGPVLAQALGPSGRGTLAAILVPFGLAPWVLSFGLPAYAAKAVAERTSRAEIVGSVGCLALVAGLIGTALAQPLASALDEGSETVHAWLVVALATQPLWLLSLVLYWVANGLERWSVVITARVAAPVCVLAGLVVLFASGQLTVAQAAAVTIFGQTASLLAVLPTLEGIGRPVVRFEVIREAVRFGSKAWVATLASLVNYRVDQLLMIPLVEPEELGLYAVAVSYATVGTIFSAAVGPAVGPLVARGDRAVARRAVRTTLTVIAIGSLGGAAVAPWVLKTIFGAGFEDAVHMSWILLLAGVPAAGAAVLTTVLSYAGRPGLPSVAELLALLVTVPGLFLVLPGLGGEGAALVSLIAYTTSFMFLFRGARRHFGGRRREFLLPAASDFGWGLSLLRPLLPSRTARAE
jgi:O-antigen/teichoic acid export membrane protein